MAQKWIVVESELVVGHVKMHYELLERVTPKGVVRGGGYWKIEGDTLHLYKWSVDYGQITQIEFEGITNIEAIKLRLNVKEVDFTLEEEL